MARIYVASSWRNDYYNLLLSDLVEANHEVWDWRKPPSGGNGFKWQDCGQTEYLHGDKIEVNQWRCLLRHPVAQRGFAADLAGMNWCDVGVLLHPCGRSAHLEAGWIAGRGRKIHVLALEPVEPDLMVLALNGKICASVSELLEVLARVTA